MGKNVINWKTKGMNQDLSVSVFNPEFSFENMNLRLSTNEGNTLMSWVNEKGTKQITLWVDTFKDLRNFTEGLIKGQVIGTAVINHKLVLFTDDTEQYNTINHIYIIKCLNPEFFTIEELYSGHLNMHASNPIETRVSYEAEHILKVYWVDGINQPRMVNIAASAEKRAKWTDVSFNFIEEFTGGKISLTKNISGGGLFAPGVIQYAFTYFNKYGQLTNIVDVTPLNYLSYSDRGASPEDKLATSFSIKIEDADTKFDYIRLYSIQRTSLNADPIVKLLTDIPISPLSGTVETELTIFEENVPLNLNITKGSYPDLILPVDSDENQILCVTATDGSLEVKISSERSVFNNNADSAVFKAITGENISEESISLLEVLNEISAGTFYTDSQRDFYIKDYYVYIDIVLEFLGALLAKLNIENTGNVTWDLFVNGERLFLNEAGILLYNLVNQKWYIISSFETVKVTTRKAVSTQITQLQGSSQYIDNGTGGAIIDPYELLFVGGKEISALTFVDKDLTLFLGNCLLKTTLVSDVQKAFDNIRGQDNENNINKVLFLRDNYKTLDGGSMEGVYSYVHTHKLNNALITCFKGGDTYRFGFQLQKNTGEWLDPIFIEDKRNPYYPLTVIDGNICTTQLSYAKASINLSNLGINYDLYKRIRPVIIYPTIADREVLCQGVINPTLFNSIDRIEKTPYALASWYFRPYTSEDEDTSSIVYSEISEVIKTGDDDYQKASDDYEELLQELRFPLTKNVYVAIIQCTTASNNHIDFIKQGKLFYYTHSFEKDSTGYIQEDYWLHNLEHTFEGAIILGIVPGILNPDAIIAVMSTNPFEPEVLSNMQTHEDGSLTDYSLVYENCDIFVGTDKLTHFPIYTGLKSLYRNLYYYQDPNSNSNSSSDSTPPYIFNFKINNVDYLVKFNPVAGYNENALYNIENSLNGTEVRFTHYSHLFTRDDLNSTNINVDSLRRKIEILNATSLYGSPFTDFEDTKKETNTEFFIDQSIVTLNSPDIEFDTNVQTYGTEGLKLRIIGAIPITANVSSHHIVTSSAMLNLSHNINQSGQVFSSSNSSKFGRGELKRNVWHPNSSVARHNAQRLVADYIWEDAAVSINTDYEDKIQTFHTPTVFLIHPWHRTGSLNNDWRNTDEASSLLRTKKEANALFSMYTSYIDDPDNVVKFNYIETLVHLTENDYVINYRLAKLKSTSSQINYYPNIDKALYNDTSYMIYPYVSNEEQVPYVTSPVLMRFKSTSHAVISLKADLNDANELIPIMPYGKYTQDDETIEVGKYDNIGRSNVENNADILKFTTFWGDTGMQFTQGVIEDKNLNLSALTMDYLWLGELYKKVENPFGNANDATALWLIAGEAANLENGAATIIWSQGDTYYLRYDCLKTFAFTNEDPNLLVEILSFMCETHVNIDGRYDKNRGLTDNTVMSPLNFNILNPVYNLLNNFFTFRKIDTEDVERLNYPNHIYFTKTKNSGADVDLWTNITLANVLELDGDKGEIRSLLRLNDLIICFQDRGISLILYNENVLISSTEGVPIEIANSGKVLGKRYLSNTIGCSNKWSIANSPKGIYFIDSIGKNIFLFDENLNLNNLSNSLGFNTWAKKNINLTENGWNPSDFGDFRTIYDSKNQEVMFINLETALAYNEKLGTFTSFYNYESTPWFCNFEDTGLWIRSESYITKKGMPPEIVLHYVSTLWQHQKGEYGKFFGYNKPYYTILIGNQESTLDKIFTNLEFRASVEGEGVFNNTTNKFTPSLPVDSLEVWNEYLHGIAYLKNLPGYKLYQHFSDSKDASLKRKFRIWRCDIPRDNYEVNASEENERGIFRFKKHVNDRIRNPWVYIKLQKNKEEDEEASLPRTEIHDIAMTYFT